MQINLRKYFWIVHPVFSFIAALIAAPELRFLCQSRNDLETLMIRRRGFELERAVPLNAPFR
jgi:hypothetical protein